MRMRARARVGEGGEGTNLILRNKKKNEPAELEAIEDWDTCADLASPA